MDSSPKTKIHIALQVPQGPRGGSFQFIHALGRQLESEGRLSAQPSDEDVILFSASQQIFKVIELKKRFSPTLFIHRIDGPIRLYNFLADRRDKVVETANHKIADGTIFQSEWSRGENLQLGLRPSPYEVVIHNAPDPAVFHKNGRIKFSKKRKIKLLAVSWSTNWKKGFKTYQWLDQHLDFSGYSMTFIGNSPVKFRNITHIGPLERTALADALREHDIFIFASGIEACSNSLLEALHCGMPTIAKNGSSNPEILKKGGELYHHPQEIPDLLTRIVNDYHSYQEKITVLSLKEVADQYYKFISMIKSEQISGRYKPKTTGIFSRAMLRTRLRFYNIQQKVITQAIRMTSILPFRDHSSSVAE